MVGLRSCISRYSSVLLGDKCVLNSPQLEFRTLNELSKCMLNGPLSHTHTERDIYRYIYIRRNSSWLPQLNSNFQMVSFPQLNLHGHFIGWQSNLNVKPYKWWPLSIRLSQEYSIRMLLV